MTATRPSEAVQRPAPLQRMAREWSDAFWGMDGGGAGRGSWAPPVDVCETDNEVIVWLDVPGLEDAEIATTLNGRRLAVSGGRPRPRLAEGARVHRFERSFGPFRREVTLPCGAHVLEPDSITASYADGVVEIRLGKARKPEPHRITASERSAHQPVAAPDVGQPLPTR